jgi:hypothetical protein
LFFRIFTPFQGIAFSKFGVSSMSSAPHATLYGTEIFSTPWKRRFEALK